STTLFRSEQALEGDLLFALEAERFGDLAFARGLFGGLDELDDLLARRKTLGQAGCVLARHRGYMGAARAALNSRRSVDPPLPRRATARSTSVPRYVRAGSGGCRRRSRGAARVSGTHQH